MKRVFAGESITMVAQDIGTSFPTVREWARRPEFGGDPNWTVPARGSNSEGSPLPLEKAPPKRPYKAKSKHEINFCPRCGYNVKDL